MDSSQFKHKCIYEDKLYRLFSTFSRYLIGVLDKNKAFVIACKDTEDGGQLQMESIF